MAIILLRYGAAAWRDAIHGWRLFRHAMPLSAMIYSHFQMFRHLRHTAIRMPLLLHHVAATLSTLHFAMSPPRYAATLLRHVTPLRDYVAASYHAAAP